jgi:hypothetical protein
MAIENKTPRMLEIEAMHDGEDINRIVPRLVEQKGLTKAAKDLGVSKDTLGKWLLTVGYTVQRKLVPIGGPRLDGYQEVT